MDKQKEFLRAKEGVSKVSREGAGQMKTDWETGALGQGGRRGEASHALCSAVENGGLPSQVCTWNSVSLQCLELWTQSQDNSSSIYLYLLYTLYISFPSTELGEELEGMWALFRLNSGLD